MQEVTVAELLGKLAALNEQEGALKNRLDEIVAALPENVELSKVAEQIAETRTALRALLTEPGKIETPNGTISLVAKRSITYPPEAVRMFAPEVAALVIKKIPAREEVDRVALERAVKAGIKAGTLEADALKKLEAKAEIVELTPAFSIKLAEPVEGSAPAPVAPF